MSNGFDAFASMKGGVAEKFSADGYTFSAGYLFTHSAFKVLRDRSECEAVSAANMYNVLIYENGSPTTDAYFTAYTSAYDAEHAPRLAVATGAPIDGSVALYFAVDGDCSADPESVVAAYFKVVHAATKAAGFACGVYGSGAVCKMLTDLGYVSKTWLSQSTGFPGYLGWMHSADIVQGKSAQVHSIDIDYDTSSGHAGGFKVQ